MFDAKITDELIAQQAINKLFRSKTFHYACQKSHQN
jgi:hypothetical protein